MSEERTVSLFWVSAWTIVIVFFGSGFYFLPTSHPRSVRNACVEQVGLEAVADAMAVYGKAGKARDPYGNEHVYSYVCNELYYAEKDRAKAVTAKLRAERRQAAKDFFSNFYVSSTLKGIFIAIVAWLCNKAIRRLEDE